ncbi:MAG: hypothetical protein JHC95_10935 [Solirubrobacteraceae bacterium]|nr:hypothetical protein [Solirubrobacteraceae bacterium]
MTLPRGTLSLVAALLLAATLGAEQATAATPLGSPGTSATPTGFACADCPAGVPVGFRQFALRGATLEAPEDGVLVAASVYAKRIAGAEQPRIAVLRPAGADGVGVSEVGSARVPVSSETGARSAVADLHLPVKSGDSIGFVFTPGEVDLGVRGRPRPDGAIQSFTGACDPCGMDGGTGTELLLDAVVEPDVDQDGLGDESQDPDGGGLGLAWQQDWFDDFEAGDELDEDVVDETVPARRQRLKLLDVDRLPGQRAMVLVRVPTAGRVSAAITLPANRRTGAGPFLTVLTGETRLKRPGRIWLSLGSTTRGARELARRGTTRTKVVVSLRPMRARQKVLMRSVRL